MRSRTAWAADRTRSSGAALLTQRLNPREQHGMLGLFAGGIHRRDVQLEGALLARPADCRQHPPGISVQAEDHVLAHHLRPAEVGQQASQLIAVGPERPPSMLVDQRVKLVREQSLSPPPIKTLV